MLKTQSNELSMLYNKKDLSPFSVLILECSNHFYGSDCTISCGHCRNGDVCNKVNGRCPNGCQNNWDGEKCDGRECT